MFNAQKLFPLFVTFVVSLSGSAQGGDLRDNMKISFLKSSAFGQIRVGVLPAKESTKTIGDILYVHGFADSFLNHGPLFQEWSNAGLRVISFDLPNHGGSRGFDNMLNFKEGFFFRNFSILVNEVELSTREDKSRPLILSGWSTGGLIATRMVQETESGMIQKPSRELSGVILFAPGVSVHLLPGTWGFVTENTLASEPTTAHLEKISPRTPLAYPLFASDLLYNAHLAYKQDLRKDIPILVYVAGDDDYVVTQDLHRWVAIQKTVRKANVYGIECLLSKHELDNEREPIGNEVRKSSVEFAKQVLSKDTNYIHIAPMKSCFSY